jgi:hypothetical protein
MPFKEIPSFKVVSGGRVWTSKYAFWKRSISVQFPHGNVRVNVWFIYVPMFLYAVFIIINYLTN